MCKIFFLNSNRVLEYNVEIMVVMKILTIMKMTVREKKSVSRNVTASQRQVIIIIIGYWRIKPFAYIFFSKPLKVIEVVFSRDLILVFNGVDQNVVVIL